MLLLIALLMTLALPANTLAAEKRYVVDNTGTLTEKELTALNARAAEISRKHHIDVAFFLADNDYAPDLSLYAYIKKCYNEWIGAESNGFMLTWDGKIRVWMMVAGGNKGKVILTKAVEERFFAAFSHGNTSFYSRIMAYLDAADEYLNQLNIDFIFTAHVIVQDYLYPILLFLIPVFIILIVLARILNRRKQYLGIQAQKRRNNFRSMTMLAFFPYVIILLAWLFSLFIAAAVTDGDVTNTDISLIELNTILIACGICLLWFLIAFFTHTSMIRAATGAKPLERRENKRVYNLVENLCMATQTVMPKINIIEDDALNAFASGINKKSFTLTLSRGLIDKLDDRELEAVIGHELAHIRNNDVKVLMVSIIFVGIFTFLTQILFIVSLTIIFRGGNDKNKKGIALAIPLLLVGIIFAAIGYLITAMMRFAISRNREYMADASSAEMTQNPLALASALRKISAEPRIKAVSSKRKDVAQLFIHNPLSTGKKGLFATHPPVEKRIEILEQF